MVLHDETNAGHGKKRMKDEKKTTNYKEEIYSE
jgi:hypothetical protein